MMLKVLSNCSVLTLRLQVWEGLPHYWWVEMEVQPSNLVSLHMLGCREGACYHLQKMKFSQLRVQHFFFFFDVALADVLQYLFVTSPMLCFKLPTKIFPVLDEDKATLLCGVGYSRLAIVWKFSILWSYSFTVPWLYRICVVFLLHWHFYITSLSIVWSRVFEAKRKPWRLTIVIFLRYQGT